MGAMIGLAMLSRAEFGLMAVIVALPAILLWGDRAWSAGLTRLALAGLAVVVLVGPWVGYNMSRFEEPVYLSTGFEVTLLSASCHNTYYGPFIGYWTQDCPKVVRAGAGEPRRVPEGEVLPQGRDHLHLRPPRPAPGGGAGAVGRITHLFRPWQQANLDWFPEGRPLGVAGAGLYGWYLLAPFAIAGGVVMRRRRIPLFPVLAAAHRAVHRDHHVRAGPLPRRGRDRLRPARGSGRRRRRSARPDTGLGSPVVADVEVPDAQEPTYRSPVSRHFHGFDGLRAIAALSVAVTHAAFLSGFKPRSRAWGPYTARLDIGAGTRSSS